MGSFQASPYLTLLNTLSLKHSPDWLSGLNQFLVFFLLPQPGSGPVSFEGFVLPYLAIQNW